MVGVKFHWKMFQYPPDSLNQNNHSQLDGFFRQGQYLFFKKARKEVMNNYYRYKILISTAYCKVCQVFTCTAWQDKELLNVNCDLLRQ